MCSGQCVVGIVETQHFPNGSQRAPFPILLWSGLADLLKPRTLFTFSNYPAPGALQTKSHRQADIQDSRPGGRQTGSQPDKQTTSRRRQTETDGDMLGATIPLKNTMPVVQGQDQTQLQVQSYLQKGNLKAEAAESKLKHLCWKLEVGTLQMALDVGLQYMKLESRNRNLLKIGPPGNKLNFPFSGSASWPPSPLHAMLT